MSYKKTGGRARRSESRVTMSFFSEDESSLRCKVIVTLWNSQSLENISTFVWKRERGLSNEHAKMHRIRSHHSSVHYRLDDGETKKKALNVENKYRLLIGTTRVNRPGNVFKRRKLWGLLKNELQARTLPTTSTKSRGWEQSIVEACLVRY